MRPSAHALTTPITQRGAENHIGFICLTLTLLLAGSTHGVEAKTNDVTDLRSDAALSRPLERIQRLGVRDHRRIPDPKDATARPRWAGNTRSTAERCQGSRRELSRSDT